MRKTWFHGLALTLGVTAIPSIASAQYSNGNSGGLAASAFSANSKLPPPGDKSIIRNNMAPQQGQTTLAAYAQNGVVGSGVHGGQIHVPESVIANPVLNTPYQSVPQYAPQASHPYEQMQPAHVAQPSYAVPQTASAQTGTSSCPACNSGSCATHGVNDGSSPMVSSTPSYGYGAAESCYSQPAVSYAPSIVSPTPWIFGASGLLFNRLDNQSVRLTTNTSDGANASPLPNPYAQSFLNTSDARMQTTGGVQLSAGRYFGCGRYAVIGSYWGIFSNPQSATILATDQINGNLRSNLPISVRGPSGAWQYGMQMPAGTYPVNGGPAVYDWYDGAAAHRILRDQQFHSAELNFFSFALGGGARQAYAAGGGCGDGHRIGFGSSAIRSLGHGGNAAGGDSCQSSCDPVSCSGPTGPCAPWYGAQCSKLRLNTYGGVRWFRFQDSLEYAASANDTTFNGGADDFYYRNRVTNDLVGFQLGSLATWCTCTRLNLFGGANFGVYGNNMKATTFAGTATQTA
ncbi:MAG TPA: hypothetical protein VM260_11765, partial [Pirellula sp.]|nr:hypothetical protein [Pirellula sp.]